MDLISDQDQGLRTQKDAMKQDAIVNAIEAMAVIGGSSVTTGDSLSATWRLLAVLRGSNWEIPLPPFGQGWFENVYMDGDIRVAKDIRGDYLVVDRAPFNWKE
ncbi:hypothetical protein Bca52824_040553 [Brassica carinata]|uniref:Plastid lipid-associated protein/fibrillin conserved domain-containing protein n=1 Tax=Brassica carinata TaxID=52824 RepID=A0A8X7RRH0_BRACI|nr:hypothetical protein Bca52824_040553 [Brassica carinata]